MRKARLIFLAGCWVAGCGESSLSHDLVLRGGRVVDPETGLDAIRDVGIRGDRFTSVSLEPLAGARVVDAQGLVVAPGFIDLHQHRHDAESYRLKAFDTVTMALELETGVPDIASANVGGPGYCAEKTTIGKLPGTGAQGRLIRRKTSHPAFQARTLSHLPSSRACWSGARSIERRNRWLV
jgi:hypothetical protein